jgi:RNA polymerase sigma-70 factor (ECF subfamily)
MAANPTLPTLSPDDVAALRPALVAFACRAVRNREFAEELVQETLLAAVAGRANFEARAKVRTWLVGILSHKIADHFRRLRAQAIDDTVEPPDLTALAAASAPDRALERKQALRMLEQALGELPALERLAVLLVDVESVDHAEACNVLAVQPTHLRVLLHRGRHRLRKALAHAVL